VSFVRIESDRHRTNQKPLGRRQEYSNICLLLRVVGVTVR
jgi:hypothetical protein